MSAETLRRAAALMREEAMRVRRPYGRGERVAVNVADWLDAEADHFLSDAVRLNNDYEGSVDLVEYEAGWFTNHPALSVARAYLEESS